MDRTAPINREKALFEQALDLASQAERLAFLKGACGEDATLCARVQALLQAHEDAGGFLPEEQAGGSPSISVSEQSGDRISHYKLLEKIGEGGYGVVYVAEQEEPVRRRVALKIIKLGMDTRDVIARFEAERQALAMMDHPNIARIFDAGVTGQRAEDRDQRSEVGAGPSLTSEFCSLTSGSGRPYFVMELVRGTKITEFCDQNHLPTVERLKLFIQVCQAIQHAHQKGVIHRDIKPSNILVSRHDDVPVPKVIDFGIAKAIGERLTDKTLYTRQDQFIGTPAYMSPEQTGWSDLDIDTRSDIYALGVLLYELLTGKTPFDTRELLKVGLDEMLRTIREQEPPRPSTRLSRLEDKEQTTTAQRRATEAPKLIHLLRGDLDWIVMKCLEKNRARRYETANALAQDLENHLSNKPVTARPPSAVYRVQKFVRRNKLMVTAGAAVAAALAIGFVGVLWQWQRAGQERDLAEAHAYAADMNLAQQALLADDLGQAQTLLGRYRPGTGREHLRGFEWRYLAAEARSDAEAMDVSSPEVAFSLAVSPDGRTVAVVRCGTIELWNPATLQRKTTLQKTPAPWVEVVFSPKGGPLAAIGANTLTEGVVQLWQLDPDRVVGELIHTNMVRGMSFSSDAKHLAVTYRPDGLLVWNVESHQVVRRYPEFRFGGNFFWGDVCFHPDGRHLVVGDGLGQIHVLDWVGECVVTNFQAHHQGITALASSPDGRLLASGSGFLQDEIRLWNPMTGEAAGSLVGHRSMISALHFTADGRWLVSSSADQTIRIWDVATRQTLRKLRGHQHEIWNMALSPDNAAIFSCSRDGAVACWALNTNPPPSQHIELPGAGMAAAFLQDGNSVVAIRRDGTVATYEIQSGRQPVVLEALGTNSSWLAVAPRSGLLACRAPDGSVRVWSLSAHRMVTHLTAVLGPEDGLFTRPVFSRAEDLLAMQSQGKAMVWDTRTWAVRSVFELPPIPRNVEFSPDSQALVVGGMRGGGGMGGGLNWWDWAKGVKLAEARDHRVQVLGLAFSPDGRTLASTSEDGTVVLYDARTFRLSQKWKGTYRTLYGVTFSPDGTRLATGLSGGQAARLWDLKTRRGLLDLTQPGHFFYTVQFTPDGDRLLCGSSDGHCYVWSPPSLAELDAEYTRQNAAR